MGSRRNKCNGSVLSDRKRRISSCRCLTWKSAQATASQIPDDYSLVLVRVTGRNGPTAVWIHGNRADSSLMSGGVSAEYTHERPAGSMQSPIDGTEPRP